MRRVEVIANHSVEDNLFEALARRGVASHHTLIPSVHGRGNSSPKKGDHIWPEENFVLIVYCEEQEATAIAEAVAEVKAEYPDEGIKIFEI